MQDHPGAPGTARKGIARTVVPATCGGVAAPKAPGPDHPLATAARLPGQGRPSAVPPARDHDRSRARHTMAPGHDRPLAASSDVARHDRPRATPRAPGADVPPAIAAGAPGQHRLSAVPPARDHDRSRARHKKAPGHDRPSVAPSGAAEHDRPCATLRAPGHDVPLVTVTGAPGYGRPSAALSVPVSDRYRPAPMARPGHALASAGTSVPITTAPLPACVSRLLQERLAGITATPDNRTYPHSHRNAANHHAPYSLASAYPQSHRVNRQARLLNCHSRESGNPRPPVATGGPQGGNAPATRGAYTRTPTYSLSHDTTANHRLASTPPLYMVERGPGGEARSTTRPMHPPITAPTAARRSPPTAASVHPATQAPTRPSPTTTGTGVSRQRHSRAPPAIPLPSREGARG